MSYKSDERGQAGYVVALLEGAGFSVWWDQKLVAGSAYDRAILDEIDRATCVLVCWSATAVHSEWVRGEAKLAHEQHKLVPVQFDRVRIPPPFTMLHTIDLTGWKGAAGEQAWVEVIRQVRQRVDPSGRTAINIRDYADSMVARSGHLIHKLKAKDTTGRSAYYFVLVQPHKEAQFLAAIDRGEGVIDLETHGTVIASCYGETPSPEIRAFLKTRFGFDV